MPPPKPKRDWSSLNHDYANVKMSGETRFEFPSSNGSHSRQGSGDQGSSRSSEQFLDQQMAKLMARKGQDEVDGSSIMKRSKSGDSLSSRKRTSEILDDDTRKILRDCQEYLLRDNGGSDNELTF